MFTFDLLMVVITELHFLRKSSMECLLSLPHPPLHLFTPSSPTSALISLFFFPLPWHQIAIKQCGKRWKQAKVGRVESKRLKWRPSFTSSLIRLTLSTFQACRYQIVCVCLCVWICFVCVCVCECKVLDRPYCSDHFR